MEFFKLLKATGFVRSAQEEALPKNRATASELAAMDPVKLGLPKLELDINNLRLNYKKSWREERVHKIDEDFELVSLSGKHKKESGEDDRKHKELVFNDF